MYKDKIMCKEIREHIDRVRNWKQFLNENDDKKLNFAKDYFNFFLEYCKNNIDEIANSLLTDGYFSFDLRKIKVEITIDDLVGSLGEYDDDEKKITIGLFKIFKQFLSKIDDLGELADYEKELIYNGIKKVLTDKNSTYLEKIKEIFIHEITHHYDNINYGEGYRDNVEKLERIRKEIEDEEKANNFYLNMHHEINSRIITALDQLIDNHGTGYGDFDTFFEMTLKYFPYYYKLSDENKKKVVKRLYKFFLKLN